MAVQWPMAAPTVLAWAVRLAAGVGVTKGCRHCRARVVVARVAGAVVHMAGATVGAAAVTATAAGPVAGVGVAVEAPRAAGATMMVEVAAGAVVEVGQMVTSASRRRPLPAVMEGEAAVASVRAGGDGWQPNRPAPPRRLGRLHRMPYRSTTLRLCPARVWTARCA